jgi:hypothetical protein
MASNGTSLEAAHACVRALIGEKLKYLVPMTVVCTENLIRVDAVIESPKLAE